MCKSYWRKKPLTAAFLDNVYRQLNKDQCVMVKTEGGKVSYCATTVDDVFFVITRDEERINEAINKLKTALEELTVDSGETMNISGMTVRMERAKRIVDNLILLLTE